MRIFVTLLIASFVALDFYLWDYLQTLLVMREKNLQPHAISYRPVANKQKSEWMVNMSMQPKRQVEQRFGKDEFVCRIVHCLDEAVEEIPLHIEKRLAEIRERVLQRKFVESKMNSNWIFYLSKYNQTRIRDDEISGWGPSGPSFLQKIYV